MKNNVIIKEEHYQQIKKKISKTDDYFTKDEIIILSQFLSQRQRENIKKYIKI